MTIESRKKEAQFHCRLVICESSAAQKATSQSVFPYNCRCGTSHPPPLFFLARNIVRQAERNGILNTKENLLTLSQTTRRKSIAVCKEKKEVASMPNVVSIRKAFPDKRSGDGMTRIQLEALPSLSKFLFLCNSSPLPLFAGDIFSAVFRLQRAYIDLSDTQLANLSITQRERRRGPHPPRPLQMPVNGDAWLSELHQRHESRLMNRSSAPKSDSFRVGIQCPVRNWNRLTRRVSRIPQARVQKQLPANDYRRSLPTLAAKTDKQTK